MPISEEARSEELNNLEMEAQDSQRNTILRDLITANYGDSDIAGASALGAYTRSEGIGGTTASWSYNEGISFVASLVVSLRQKVDDMTQEMRSLKDDMTQEMRSLKDEMSQEMRSLKDEMTQEMRGLKEAVLSIERAISVEESGDEDESAIEVTREEAKEMVAALFHEKGQLGYSDIMSTLRLDLELIVEICAELETDGKIEGVD